MSGNRLTSLSLLWKILLSTSIAITILFATTLWIVQDQFVRSASQTVDEEVQVSFRSYDSLWQARANHLAALSEALSQMSDVRAAFGTGDRITIRDTAGEIWNRIAQDDAIFLVTDPRGAVIASLGGFTGSNERHLDIVTIAAERFPKQSSGFLLQGGVLYQTVVTPVYVAANQGSALLNVLVAGYAVNPRLARSLKEATGGSEFIFLAGSRVITSTQDSIDLSALISTDNPSGELPHVRTGGSEYAQFATPLLDIRGQSVGELRILRSFDLVNQRITSLRYRMIALWLFAVLIGLALTSALARHLLKPIRALDAAAIQIAQGNYETRVQVSGRDELGRLGQTFNAMCASIRSAREETIRQERLSTIGRLATSIVHDLRNPLAAIYGGAEMLANGDLSSQHIRRLATNIHLSSRRVEDLLRDLSDVTRGRTHSAEPCRLHEVVSSACQTLAADAELHNVRMKNEIPAGIELSLQRSRMERVFENLLANAIEAMPQGGVVRVDSETKKDHVLIAVEDNGPGLSPDLTERLFEPFVTEGKRKGMGLGLALSRQTVRDHGGDLYVEAKAGHGARFMVRLPLVIPNGHLNGASQLERP